MRRFYNVAGVLILFFGICVSPHVPLVYRASAEFPLEPPNHFHPTTPQSLLHSRTFHYSLPHSTIKIRLPLRLQIKRHQFHGRFPVLLDIVRNIFETLKIFHRFAHHLVGLVFEIFAGTVDVGGRVFGGDFVEEVELFFHFEVGGGFF